MTRHTRTFLFSLSSLIALTSRCLGGSNQGNWQGHLSEGYGGQNPSKGWRGGFDHQQHQPNEEGGLPSWMPFHLGERAEGRHELLPNSYTGTSYSPEYVYQPSQPTVYMNPPSYDQFQSENSMHASHLAAPQQQQGRPESQRGQRRPPPRRRREVPPQQGNDRTYSYNNDNYRDVLANIIERPHLEDSHITGLTEREQQVESADSDADGEQEEDEGERYDDDARALRTPPMPKLSNDELRAMFNQEWHDRGLNFRLHPGQLALKVAEMKLSLGYPGSIGRRASYRVRRRGPDQDYIELYMLYSVRYTRKIIKLKRTYAKNPRITTLAQRDALLWKNFRNIVPKDYLHDLDVNQPAVNAKQFKTGKERRKVGANFVQDRVATRPGPLLDPNTLSIKQLEEYSRDYETRGHTRQVTTEILKRYFRRELHKTQEDLDEFMIRRAAYRNRYRVQLRIAIRQREENDEPVEEAEYRLLDELDREIASEDEDDEE